MQDHRIIDLRSDTVTRPTPEMRQAMCIAEVGDEQRGDDPTVNRLCERVAEIVGKESALFLPSGTMCNQIAVLVHCRPGDEIIAADIAHLIRSEAAGPSALAGAQLLGVESQNGVFTAETLLSNLRPKKRNAPRSRLVEIEQTVNGGGGKVWPLEAIQSVGQRAKEHGLLMHMDGARLFNAIVATGISAATYSEPFDSVWVDLSKGLGCPIGGVLAGSHAFIEECWPWKHRLGGGMRQAGIIAAAGLHALDYHVERLAEDHENARHLAEGLSRMQGLKVDLEGVETNIVFVECKNLKMDAFALKELLEKHNILIDAVHSSKFRLVTHLDITPVDINYSIDMLVNVMK